MNSKILEKLAETYDTVLADKYGIDRDHETWEVNLYNQLCLIVDLEQSLNRSIDEAQAHNEKLMIAMGRLIQVETFMIQMLTGPDTTDMFKTKLKQVMLAKGYSFQLDNDEGFIRVPDAKRA